ncbi:hypothetical protein PG988_002661 [Apiospora saccharicola]
MASTPGLPSMTPEHMNEDKRPTIIHVTVWLHVLSTLCLILRLASRKATVMQQAIITMAANGAGQHVAAILTKPDPASAIASQLKAGYAISPLNTTQLTLTKASALMLYFRIFPQRYIRRGVYIIGAVLTAWWAAFVAVNLFGCDPISRGWADSSNSCVSRSYAVNTFGTICDTIINVLILALPVRAIIQLHVKNWQRIAIIGLFLLGGLSTASAWIRWWAVEQFRFDPVADMMYFQYKVLIFLTLEMAAGVMGVSLSTVTPILSYFTLRLGFKRASMALNKADVAGLVTIGGSDGSLQGPASRPESRPRLFNRRTGEQDTVIDDRHAASEPTSGTA